MFTVLFCSRSGVVQHFPVSLGQVVQVCVSVFMVFGTVYGVVGAFTLFVALVPIIDAVFITGLFLYACQLHHPHVAWPRG